MDKKEEYICGSKELDNLLNSNGGLLALSFIIFVISVFIGINDVFFISFIGISISFFIFIAIDPKGEDDKAILENIIKMAKISQNVLLFFLLATIFAICYGFLKRPFNLGCILGYIFFFINIKLFFNFKNISKVSGDVLEKLEYKTKVKEDIDNMSFRVTKTLSIIEHMFDGLEYDEKDILRPCVQKLQELFMLSYDTLYNIKNPNMFYDIESFILRYAKTIQAYRKSKGVADLDFLKRLNSSAEELYFALNSKEQALKKNDFDNKIEMLKIKLNNTWKGVIFYEK